MKKALMILTLFASFSFSAFAQDRTLPQRRVFAPLPQLSVLYDTDNAAGLVQTPWGYALPLAGNPIPAGSRVGIFGHFLLSNSINKVLLWGDMGVMVADVEVTRNGFPGLEMAIFRLPDGLHGDVWVTTMGRQFSNSVRIVVE